MTMYREYFGLTRRTFDKDIKTHELFPSENSVELENRLKYLLALKGIGLITGDVGSGKTTICRKVISELHSGLYKVFYVCLTTGNVMDVYKANSDHVRQAHDEIS
ncbi:MAG: ATP-binding protein [Thermodesulfobacteriota bacterium]|nr:ATP-binding protein [Thermodesulfobacteriota bacterium]